MVNTAVAKLGGGDPVTSGLITSAFFDLNNLQVGVRLLVSCKQTTRLTYNLLYLKILGIPYESLAIPAVER